MTFADWTFYLVGAFLMLESEKFRGWKAGAFVTGAALMFAAIVAASVGCAPVPTAPSGYTSPAVLGDGSARVSTMAVTDRPSVNSCSIEGFRIHQSDGPHGALKTTFEMPGGVGVTRYETRYRRRTNPTGGPDVFTGPYTTGANGEMARVDNIVTIPGFYEGQMRGLGCANWATDYFTIAGPEPEPKAACPIEPWTPNCVAWD